MRHWQKLVFYLVTAFALVPAVQLFAVLTLTSAHFSSVERWLLGSLSVGVVIFSLMVWKRERFALVPAIAADVLFSLWFMRDVFEWREQCDVSLHLLMMLAYGLSGIMAAVVLAILGPKHCGPYFPLKG